MKKYSFSQMNLILTTIVIIITVVSFTLIKKNTNTVNNNETDYILSMKKAYSEINNAIKLAAKRDGRILTMQDRAYNAYKDIFEPHIKTTNFKRRSGQNSSAIFTTESGFVIGMSKGDTDACNNMADSPNDPCAFIIVDVNGAKGPNKITLSPQIGKIYDQFSFPVFADGIMAKPNSPEAILLSRGPIKEAVPVKVAVCGENPSWVPYDEHGALIFEDVPAYRFEGRGFYNCP